MFFALGRGEEGGGGRGAIVPPPLQNPAYASGCRSRSRPFWVEPEPFFKVRLRLLLLLTGL